MKRLLTIPIFFLLIAVACAQIDGPDEVGVYKLVKLRSAESADGYTWLIGSSVATVEIEPVGDGREAVFVGPPGEYVVTLIATTVNWDTRDFAQKQSTKRVRITGDRPPPPGPGPTPPTPPTPLPDGTYKLAQFAFDAAQQVTAKQYAPQLADTFESVAAQMAAGTIRTIPDANTKIKNDNLAILGADREQWLPWLNAMNAKMNELWKQSANIQTIPGMAGAYREIATGLRAVK